MKLGIGSHSFGWQVGVAGYLPEKPMTIWDLLERAQLYGVKVIQIADNMPLESYAWEELEAYKAATQKANIAVEVGMRGLLPDLVKKYLEYAVFFQSPILRIVIDRKEYEPSKLEIISILKQLETTFIENKVILAIENHDRFRSAELLQVLSAVRRNAVGICLDTVNSMGAGEGVETIVENLVPVTVNLHLKDFRITRVPYLMGFVIEGCPAGQGKLNVPELVEKICQYRPEANAILELWTPPENNIEETIKKEEDWVSQSIQYLRSYIPQ